MSDYKQNLNQALDAWQTGQVNTAALLFEDIIKKYPDKIDGYYCYAKMELTARGNFNKAIELFKKAIDVAPFYEAFKDMADAYILKQDPKNALFCLKQALLHNPECKISQNYLARLEPNNNYVKAKELVFDKYYETSKDCPQCTYNKIYDAGIINREPPAYVAGFLTSKQNTMLEEAIEKNSITDFKEGFVIKLPDGRAFIKQSEQTHIISADGRMLKDMLVEDVPQISVDKMNNEIRIADKLQVLSSAWGGNFYHWLTWTVPRIYMMEKAGYNFNYFDKIAVNYLGFKFQRELIDLLKIPKDKIIPTLSDGTVLRARTLVTASLPSHFHTPKIVTDALREKFLSADMFDENSPKRIYLSRNKSNFRHVLNEDEVLDYLYKFGFTVIYAEEHTFLEQVKLFANADVVISQHGAGLVNLSFSKPGSKLIEIHNENFKDYVDTGYFRICANVGLEHYLMFGEPHGVKENANMVIDIKKLAATLDLAGVK